ncbi:MAG TPA: hypothetical protein VGJ33_04310 [Candidatus Angelobacter sp.]|jgi:hypothetical protein
MTLRWVLCLSFALVIGFSTAFAADGTFRGKITDPPGNVPAVKGWIFIEGMNHMLRRVEVAHAQVVFGEELPAGERRSCNSDCLKPGQEVRVTAHQDSSGEWRAIRVEILKIIPKTSETRLQAISLLNLTTFSSLLEITRAGKFRIAKSTGEI